MDQYAISGPHENSGHNTDDVFFSVSMSALGGRQKSLISLVVLFTQQILFH